MCPPIGSPLKSKLMSIYLPKRLELSLRVVLAFPKASRMQLDCRRMFFTLEISNKIKDLKNEHAYQAKIGRRRIDHSNGQILITHTVRI